ncbi:hypothetical protein OIE62_05510 [Streptomyces scopuliridis]|uniref:Uncharacterized protein n=1 Tax=Streptomyces scopuliridis TaxID=452529 RepID=A0ACD4ZV89_9ACTN|nr:hypothetical protein [Streptomyces scopuliridis]WSB37321.1 hypothetical protein OG949_33760 [Streptomyces scopuliridis]WSC01937.1 hypothetical protein OG835_36320 [Streptomyces scopuliridis]WSC04526.1 hypothetical protein OIE62_05510 [Streptomyces scopuliridis]
MTSQTPEKSPSRKQRLQEKQRRQLAVVDTIDKAEAKLRKAEAELAEAVAEAVEVFGSEQGASEELGLSVDAIRGFLSLVEGGASGADEPDGAAETVETAPAQSPAKAKVEAKAEAKPEPEPVAV